MRYVRRNLSIICQSSKYANQRRFGVAQCKHTPPRRYQPSTATQPHSATAPTVNHHNAMQATAAAPQPVSFSHSTAAANHLTSSTMQHNAAQRSTMQNNAMQAHAAAQQPAPFSHSTGSKSPQRNASTAHPTAPPPATQQPQPPNRTTQQPPQQAAATTAPRVQPPHSRCSCTEALTHCDCCTFTPEKMPISSMQSR